MGWTVFKPCRALTLVFALVALGCTADSAEAPAGNAPWHIQPGVEAITITNADPDEPLTLYGPEGTKLVTLLADDLGQAHFAYIPTEHQTIETGESGELPSYDGATLAPGDGYVVKNDNAGLYTGPIRVLGVHDVAPDAHYDKQVMYEGLNYIEMRDGTLLSATVWYPEQTIWGEGPWPTVVNYSGYGPSNPDSPPPGALLANLMLGYATVGVNMRGTGCSGGVFDVFNPAQHADGYDIIEVVGRQWFVKGNKVGTVGLSYPGISQLYIGYTQPPHLAAIAPLSVIEDPWRQQWPGGIYNSGFTKNWIEERNRQAEAGGQGWAKERIENGDTVCERNQDLRSQNVDFEAFGRALTTFPPDAADRRMTNLVDRIDVPVYLTGAWQDEQTGSRFATMLDNFDNAPVKKFTMFNGRHPDGYTPLVLVRWMEFLEFYVAERIPRVNGLLRLVSPTVIEAVFGAREIELEPDRFDRFLPDRFDEALAAYEAEPSVRLLFESGYGAPETEAPLARFETQFEAWPPPAESAVWYLGPDGTLTDAAPEPLTASDDGVDSFRHDPKAGDISYLKRDSLFRIRWNWEPAKAGYNLGYLSEPLAEDTLIAGNGGYVDLWFATDGTAGAHVEVNLFEVRADGTEFLIQSGVFNLAHRKGIDEEHSGPHLIEYTYRAEDLAPVPAGTWMQAKVPIRPFSHLFRAGTRIRLTINTPGRDAPYWEYENPTYATPATGVFHHVARTPAKATKLVLPRVPPETHRFYPNVPDDAPPCYSLRGIVCRDFLPLPVTAVDPTPPAP